MIKKDPQDADFLTRPTERPTTSALSPLLEGKVSDSAFRVLCKEYRKRERQTGRQREKERDKWFSQKVKSPPLVSERSVGRSMTSHNAFVYLAALGFVLRGADCATTPSMTSSTGSGRAGGNASITGKMVRYNYTSARPGKDDHYFTTTDPYIPDHCPNCLRMMRSRIKSAMELPVGGLAYCTELKDPYFCVMDNDCDITELQGILLPIDDCHFSTEIRSSCDECFKLLTEATAKADYNNETPGSISYCLHMMMPLFCYKIKRCPLQDGVGYLCLGVVKQCHLCADTVTKEARSAATYNNPSVMCPQIDESVTCLIKNRCQGYLANNVSSLIARVCPSVDFSLSGAPRATGEPGIRTLAFSVVFLAGLTSGLGI